MDRQLIEEIAERVGTIVGREVDDVSAALYADVMVVRIILAQLFGALGRVSGDFPGFLTNEYTTAKKNLALAVLHCPNPDRAEEIRRRAVAVIDDFFLSPVYFPMQDSYLMFSEKDLYMLNSSSGFIEELEIENMSKVSDISWDGTWILYTDTSEEQKQVLYNTKTRTSHYVFPESTIQPQWVKFSPDGKKISFCLKTVDESDHQWKIYIYDLGLVSDQVAEVETQAPSSFELTGNFPNPFNMTTTIEFSLPDNGYTTLIIYNINGQKIRELVSGEMTTGTHRVVWDSTDDSGLKVSSGSYLTRLTQGKKMTTGRMMLMK